MNKRPEGTNKAHSPERLSLSSVFSFYLDLQTLLPSEVQCRNSSSGCFPFVAGDSVDQAIGNDASLRQCSCPTQGTQAMS